MSWRSVPGAMFDIEIGINGDVVITPTLPNGQPMMKPINQCEHCKRADWVPLVYRSFEEAEAAGLVERA